MTVLGRNVIEADLRDYLTESGYYGRSAKFARLKLVAVERPGWLQVYDFHVRVKSVEGEWKKYFGLCRTDERHDIFEVQMFDTVAEQQQTFRSEAQGMITGERGPRHWVHTPLLILFLVAMSMAALGAIVSSLK